MTETSPAPRHEQHVVALSADLMDRSKISGAFPDAVLVRSVAKLTDAVTADSLVFVDLGRVDDLSALQDLGIRNPGTNNRGVRVIGFGSHVNEEQLAAATAVGIEATPRSVFFRRLEQGDF